MENEIKLGAEVKDTVSGYAGIITARCEYLRGVTRLLVTGPLRADGKFGEEWFDESRIALLFPPAVKE